MVPGPPARLASRSVHLKTSLALSLALLMGTAPAVTQAASSRRGSSASARKSKKTSTKTPPEKSTATPEETPAAPPADAPVEPAPAQQAATPAETPAPAAQATLPATPWAGRLAILAVPVDRGTSEPAALLESELRSALATQSDVYLVDLASVFPPPPPASLKHGDDLYAEGKSLYDNLDPEAAAKKFSEAGVFYEQHAADVKPERLARLYIFLGASRMLNGDVAGAKEAFTRALLASGSEQPSSDIFGQDVQDAFNAAKVALSRQPKGTLAINSFPEGARAYVHGQDVGTTPVKDVELAPGAHQVVLTLPGHVPTGMFQEVTASQRAEMRPLLQPLPGLAEVQTLAAQASASPKALDADKTPPQVTAIGDKLGARYVVLAVMKQERAGALSASLHAWDLQGKNRLSGVSFRTEDLKGRQQAVASVHDFVTGKLVPSSSQPLAMPAVVKKPWFWAAVGGVAVAATAGVLLATQPNSPSLGARLGNPGAGW